jgi:hypothetical protein
MRIARWACTVVLLAPLIAPLAAVSARAQEQQEDSLAAAARRSQEQKKDQAKPAAKVWDNDTLPSKAGAISVVGQTGDSTNSSAARAANTAAEIIAAPTPEDKAALESEVAAAKSQLANLKADLDVMQRKYALDQMTYYGTTNYAADTAGAAALAAEKSNIDAKQAAVAVAEKLLADAQARLDAANKAAAAAAALEAKAARASSANSVPGAAQPPANPAPPAYKRTEASNPN